MRIRRADPERDAAACAAIYAPYVLGEATSMEEDAPGAAEIAARIRRLAPTHPWLVAEVGGEVVGYAYGSPHAERAGYRWTVDLAVYVRPDHHRSGVARRLYEELLACLRAQGFRTACAIVTLPNEASVAFHEALGFVPVGVFRRAGWKGGAWRDVGWWQLDLAPGQEEPPAEPSPPSQT